MRATTILDTIGHTPHVRMQRLFTPRVQVWMKLERANPGGSIKDRIALAMIEDARRSRVGAAKLCAGIKASATSKPTIPNGRRRERRIEKLLIGSLPSVRSIAQQSRVFRPAA